MGATQSIPGDELAKVLINDHTRYELYPCFFACHEDGHPTLVGCLSDFEGYLAADSTRGQKKFTILCLGDGLCGPCDIAKDYVRRRQEQGGLPNVSILERSGSRFVWRTDPLKKKLTSVRQWAFV